MPIQTGDRLPAATFRIMTPSGPANANVDAIFAGRKVALVGAPAAFGPLGHRHHIPGFLERAGAFRRRGVDFIAITAVNDVFVMEAWRQSYALEGDIRFLADGNGDFARAMGLEIDLSTDGLGFRSRRYSALIENAFVKTINIEPRSAGAEISSAENLLARI